MKFYHLITHRQWKELQSETSDKIPYEQELTSLKFAYLNHGNINPVVFRYDNEIDEVVRYCVKNQDFCKNLYPTLEKLGLYYGNNTYNKDDARFTTALKEALSSEQAVLLEKNIAPSSGMLSPLNNFLTLSENKIPRKLTPEEIRKQELRYHDENNWIALSVEDLPNQPFTLFHHSSQKFIYSGKLDSKGHAYVKLDGDIKLVDVVFDKQTENRPWYYDVPLQLLGGIRDAAQSLSDLAWDISPIKQTIEHDFNIEIENPSQLGEVPGAETLSGALTRGVTQFLTGFIPALRATKFIKPMQKMGSWSKGMIAGGFADFAVFSPHEQRLSNLIEEHPQLSNPITQYLQAKPEDSVAEGRLKNALEGLMIGALAEPLARSLRALKYARIKWTTFEVRTKVHYKLNVVENKANLIPELKQIHPAIPKLEYEKILKDSIKNSESDTMVLGKYTKDNSSYLSVAKENGAMYFDMGDNWGKVQSQYNLSNNDMFKLFNVPALDEAIKSGKTIKFTHNPNEYDGFLRDELKYLEKNGYFFDKDSMSAILLTN